MRIVDKDVEVYRLRFRSSSQQGRTNKELIAVDLTTDFVANPYYTQKLELGRDWYVTIQAQNNNYLSSVVTMAAGSYDPDHQSGGQAVVNYGSPFSMSLPSLEENGSVTLTADKQGFSVGVSG